ncbi:MULTISPECIES: hypothetical protein [Ureibacillus]|jgi:hypothetical protein|nr:hypothetical protein [Ureibacillus thermosphaericus]
MSTIKKFLIYFSVLILLVSNIPMVNAQENNNLEKESFIVNEKEFLVETDNSVQPAALPLLVVPAIAISDYVWAAAGLTVAAGVYQLWLKEPTLVENINIAYKAIPKKLLNNDGYVDLGKFTDKVNGKTAYKDPKTGWQIDKDTAGHGGRKWKLKDNKGNTVASLDEKGKILNRY